MDPLRAPAKKGRNAGKPGRRKPKLARHGVKPITPAPLKVTQNSPLPQVVFALAPPPLLEAAPLPPPPAKGAARRQRRQKRLLLLLPAAPRPKPMVRRQVMRPNSARAARQIHKPPAKAVKPKPRPPAPQAAEGEKRLLIGKVAACYAVKVKRLLERRLLQPADKAVLTLVLADGPEKGQMARLAGRPRQRPHNPAILLNGSPTPADFWQTFPFCTVGKALCGTSR